MKRIEIPSHYVHTRSTPFWNRETAPPGIWRRHLDAGTRQGVYPRLSVMEGIIRYYNFSDEFSPEVLETLTIEEGQFAVFPPEKWHFIEALTDDVLFSVDFYVDPQILIEG
ncbi:DUF1971 domain-containing protein [Buttiauxella noackiae]|jgi:tellurite resistance-related uncharacterized protein|uniref:DUF1971 domain-containing protein n=1 Tax=Buttiauxella noackiae TaxID=82992 RepID=UPI0023521E0D|nr:DUF1971 domain-containing protein [Buttiauxella noackiae]MCA1923616.1 DUF1971 domain-containing protein [Buttiauxella noackiae]